MKLFALLFLILSAVLGKAWGYGVPAISVGEDMALLTDTPIPIPHLTSTPTKTATPSPTITFTPTLTATASPTVMILMPTTTPAALPDLSALKPIPSPTTAPIPTGFNAFREQAFFELGLGVDPPVQGSVVPGTATGGKAALGILFNDGFAVQLDVESSSQSNSNKAGTLSENEILVLPTLRRYLTAGNVRPYLSNGNGLAINTTTSWLNSASVESFDMALGVGFEFVFENSFCTYVEGKYNFVFMSASPNQDIPVVVGARLGL